MNDEEYSEAFKRWETLINEEYRNWKMMRDTQMSEDDFKDWVVQKLIALFALSERNQCRDKHVVVGVVKLVIWL